MIEASSSVANTYVRMNARKPALFQLFQKWGFAGILNFPDRRRKRLAAFIKGESMKSMFDIGGHLGVHKGKFASPLRKKSSLGNPREPADDQPSWLAKSEIVNNPPTVSQTAIARIGIFMRVNLS